MITLCQRPRVRLQECLQVLEAWRSLWIPCSPVPTSPFITPLQVRWSWRVRRECYPYHSGRLWRTKPEVWIFDWFQGRIENCVQFPQFWLTPWLVAWNNSWGFQTSTDWQWHYATIQDDIRRWPHRGTWLQCSLCRVKTLKFCFFNFIPTVHIHVRF